jgi:hypothetical protein
MVKCSLTFQIIRYCMQCNITVASLGNCEVYWEAWKQLLPDSYRVRLKPLALDRVVDTPRLRYPVAGISICLAPQLGPPLIMGAFSRDNTAILTVRAGYYFTITRDWSEFCPYGTTYFRLRLGSCCPLCFLRIRLHFLFGFIIRPNTRNYLNIWLEC